MNHGARGDFFGGGGSAGPLFDRPDTRLPMTDEELRVSRILERHRGRAHAVPRKEIERITGLDERGVKAAVEGLRKSHDWPIGAIRSAGGGYFLCVDEEDMAVAFGPYLAQAIDMIRFAKHRVPARVWAEVAGQLRLELQAGDTGQGTRDKS